MNTEPMTIPEIALEYVTGGLAQDPAPGHDTTRPASLGGSLGGQVGGSEGDKAVAK